MNGDIVGAITRDYVTHDVIVEAVLHYRKWYQSCDRVWSIVTVDSPAVRDDLVVDCMACLARRA